MYCLTRFVFLIAISFSALTIRAETDVAETVDPAAIKQAEAAGKAREAAIKVLIDKLAAPDTVQREDAEKALLAFGSSALPALKNAASSPNPEIAARAKKLSTRLADSGLRPKNFAAHFPEDSVFYFEIPDSQALLTRFQECPVGKALNQPESQKYWEGYRKDQIEAELKVLDSMISLSKLTTGKVFIAIGAPDTIEPNEIDPPLIMGLETKNLLAAEAQVRDMFEGMGDPLKTKSTYKQFQIDMQVNAGTVFGQERVTHALTPKALNTFLDYLLKPPAQSLAPAMQNLKSIRPNADAYWRLSANGLKLMGESMQMLDLDQAAILETAGFTSGSVAESALSINANGIEELIRLNIAGGDKNKGLLGVLSRLTVPPIDPNKPQAIDLIPFQAAMLITLHADTIKSAAEVSAALQALDRLGGEPIHDDKILPPAEEIPLTAKSKELGNSPALEALSKGGGGITLDQEARKKLKSGQPAEVKEPERSTPHLDRLLKSGIRLEKLLAEIDGPVQLALFPEQVDVSRLYNPNLANPPADPDRVPMSAVLAMVLKDPKEIEDLLDKTTAGLKIRYKKQVMNGGTFYLDAEAFDADEEDSPGFWLKGKYLAYGTSRDVLELSTAALLNANGNQRIASRKEFQKHLAQHQDPAALIQVFADSTLFFDMPYKISQIAWQFDPANIWPRYEAIAKPLKDNLMFLTLKQAPGGLQIEAQSPLTILGVIESVRRPLRDLNLIF